MIPKRLVNLIFTHILDPWYCSLDARVSDMEHALDDAIGNSGYVDGIYFLKADHVLQDTGKIFPMYRVSIMVEVRGRDTAIQIGEIVSISVMDHMAELMVDNKGKVHYITLPTDSEDIKASEMLLRRRGYKVKR